MSALTVEEIIRQAETLDPTKASKLGEGIGEKYCVSPLYDHIEIDGEEKELKLIGGKHAALYVRVSTMEQRGKANNEDGWSESDQIERGVRYFARQGMAFRIYSDCGLHGWLPINKPDIIESLWKSKAARWEKMYRRIFFDESFTCRLTQDDLSRMEEYCARRVAEIKKGKIKSSDYAGEEKSDLERFWDHRADGRPKHQVVYRLGLTSLWNDYHKVHTVALTDLSRMTRDADFQIALLKHFDDYKVNIVGLVEDLSKISITSSVERMVTYVLASMNEYKLEEVQANVFRGLLTLVQSGRPHGMLPTWLERDDDGYARLKPSCDAALKRMVELYLTQDIGQRGITNILNNEGYRQANGGLWKQDTVWSILQNPALNGKQEQFGIMWEILPKIVDDETWEMICAKKRERRELSPNQHAASFSVNLASGILKCSCGKSLRYNQDSRRKNSNGYTCKADGIRKETGQTHTYINASVVEPFIEGLMENYGTILAQDNLPPDDTRSEIAKEIIELTTKLEKAMTTLMNSRKKNRKLALEKAKATGFEEGTEAFNNIVQTIQDGLVVDLLTEVDAINSTIKQKRDALTKTVSSKAHTEVLERIQKWTTLDSAGKNNVLRTLFESWDSIEVDGVEHFKVKLRYSDKELPLIRVDKIKHRAKAMPNPDEWIAQVLGAA